MSIGEQFMQKGGVFSNPRGPDPPLEAPCRTGNFILLSCPGHVQWFLANTNAGWFHIKDFRLCKR